MPHADALVRPDPEEVLARATLRTAEALGLSNQTLARVLGCSAATITRMSRGRGVVVESKQGELALLLVRLYRALDTMVGGDAEAARLWLRAHNHYLGGIPAERITTVEGLVHVVEYLDAMRGKL